jgi:hypothetical protein
MPSREEMIEYITETIQEASDLDLEQYFWLMMEEEIPKSVAEKM